jgi:hypothetical protein
MFSFLTSAAADKAIFESKNFSGVWEEGNDACFSCDKRFSFTIRRHHCRLCGKECCATCSALKMEGTRVCIFCFVSSKDDVLTNVKASKAVTPPAKNSNKNSYTYDTSNLSSRDTLESFVINQSIVSMCDINDQHDNNETNDTSGSNDIFMQTPSREGEDNTSKAQLGDTFVAPWSVSPSSTGNSTNTSPVAVTANMSPCAVDSRNAINDLHSSEEKKRPSPRKQSALTYQGHGNVNLTASANDIDATSDTI